MKESGRGAGSWEGPDCGALDAKPEAQWISQVKAFSWGAESSAWASDGRSGLETQKRGVKGAVTIWATDQGAKVEGGGGALQDACLQHVWEGKGAGKVLETQESPLGS